VLDAVERIGHANRKLSVEIAERQRTESLLRESRGWFTYDLPPALIGKAWNGRFRGQRQKWYALRFTGSDDEIDVANPGGHHPEFVAWRWAAVAELPDLVVPFKRQVYEAIVAEFACLAAP